VRGPAIDVIPQFKNFKCESKTAQGGTAVVSNTCRGQFFKSSFWCDGREPTSTKHDFESLKYCMTAPSAEGQAGGQVRIPNTQCANDGECRDASIIPASRFRCNLNLGVVSGMCEYQVDSENYVNLGHPCTADGACADGTTSVRGMMKCAGVTGMCTAGKSRGDGTLFKIEACTTSECPQFVSCQTDQNCQAVSGEASIPDAYMRCNPKGSRCEMLNLAKTDEEKDAADSVSVVIPFWNGPNPLTPPFSQGSYSRLGYCATHDDCTNAAARAARRCELRQCHLGEDWGGFAIPGTSCTRSSDCPAQLTWDKWSCLKPQGTSCGQCKGRCQLALDNSGVAGDKKYLTNWESSGFDCFQDADCQSTALLDSLTCEGEIRHKATGESTSTTMYIAVSPKNVYDWDNGAYKNTSYSDTSIEIEWWDGVNRTLNGQISNYNQQMISPICYYDPPAVQSTGQQISVWGRNFAHLWKDEGAFAIPIGKADATPPYPTLRKKRKQTPRCVFRTKSNFARCVTSSGIELPGSTCSTDAHCRVTYNNPDYVYLTGSQIKPFSNVDCMKSGSAATGFCYYTPSYCPHTTNADICKAEAASWQRFSPELACTDYKQCLAVLTTSTCKHDLKPQCALPSGGALLGASCTVKEDCRDTDILDPTKLKCTGAGLCAYDEDGDENNGMATIPGTACSNAADCTALQSTLVCLPETLKTEATIWTDELVTCEAPPSDMKLHTYTGEAADGTSGGTYSQQSATTVQPVLAGFELGMLEDTDDTIAEKWELASPPLLARTYSAKKLITGQTPPPPPLSSEPTGAYQVDTTMSYYDVQQQITTITPPGGPINGNTQITITGSNFYETYIGGAWVKVGSLDPVGEHNVTGTGTSFLELTTQPYNGPAGVAGVGISLNYADYGPVNYTFPFVYYDEPIITSIDPSVGDPTGGTLVTVVGMNFQYIEQGNWNKSLHVSPSRCRFGNVNALDDIIVTSPTGLGSKVEPINGGATAIICIAPPAEGPQEADFEVTFNGQQYTSSGKKFIYASPLVETGTCYHDSNGYALSQPACSTSAACRSDTQYELTPWRCRGSPYCKVGIQNQDGELIGSDCLNDHDCEVLNPAHFKCNPGTGVCQWGMYNDFTDIPNWDITQGSRQCVTDADCVKDATQRTCHYPKMCRTGKNYGGGIIMPELSCNNDADCNPTTNGGQSKFLCENPICKYDGNAIPQLTDYKPPDGSVSELGYPNNCVGSITCQNSQFFAAMRCSSRFEVEVVEPSAGPDIGGTNVTIRAKNIQDSRNLMCKFGQVLVRGTFGSCGADGCTMVCTSPRHFTYTAAVLATPNGDAWSGNRAGACIPQQLSIVASQLFLEDKIYDAASCSAQCALRSWCDLFLVSTGVGIQAGACMILSQGCTLSTNDGTFNGYRNTFTELNTCNHAGCTPRNSAVYLEVSNNGQDFTNNQVQFTYYSSLINVTRVLPEIGPNEGNTIVILSGSGFINTARLQLDNIRCKFWTKEVVATYNVGDDTVECVSPSAFTMKNWAAIEANIQAGLTGFSGVVPLELSFDRGQHYTTSNMSFIYSGELFI